MRATGIVRKIDELGRIVIPKELRRILNIDVKDAVEILSDGEKIVLQKYSPGCKECGETDVPLHGTVQICKNCLTNLTETTE